MVLGVSAAQVVAVLAGDETGLDLCDEERRIVAAVPGEDPAGRAGDIGAVQIPVDSRPQCVRVLLREHARGARRDGGLALGQYVDGRGQDVVAEEALGRDPVEEFSGVDHDDPKEARGKGWGVLDRR
jgi:hypothetical protein